MVLAGVLMAALSAGPAEAHRLKAFATVEGTTITGSAYFPGMGVARGVSVQVLAPDGRILAEALTDDEGRFALTAGQRVDHRIVVDSGDGHRAEFLVRAAELPETLPPGDAAATPASPSARAIAATPPTAGAGGVVTASPITPELEAALDRAVARHVAPLRTQLDAFEDTIRFRDILGGLGWIVGATGIAFWIAIRRNR